MTPMETLGVVVLAAGQSSRMQGEHKLLKLWRGKPLLAHALQTVTELQPAFACVVTGRSAEDVHALADAASIHRVHNPAFDTGVASSIRVGLAAMPPAVQGAFIVLGDMPFVRREDFDALAAAFAPELGRDICICSHDGRRGHPVLFGRSHFSALMELQGDVGGAKIIAQNSQRVIQIQISSPRVLIDFDTVDDFNFQLNEK